MLPNKKEKYIFGYEVAKFWTNWQPYRLSHIHGLHINFSRFSKCKIKDVWIWKVIVLESTIFVCFIPIEMRQKLLVGFNFLWLSWFSAKNNTCVNICTTVYMRQKLATFGIYEILGPTFAAFRPTQQKTRHKLSSVYCRLLNYYSRAIG